MSNFYLGRSPDTGSVNEEEGFFYGLRRDEVNGWVIVDKINLDASFESVELTDLNSYTGTGREFENFEQGVDFYDGRDASHNLLYDGLKYEQYKWSGDDLYYFINEEGQLCVRVDREYFYSEGVSQTVLPEQMLYGNPIDLGSIISANPLENENFASLSTITDPEATQTTLDLGSII